jgi:hypothetical protein
MPWGTSPTYRSWSGRNRPSHGRAGFADCVCAHFTISLGTGGEACGAAAGARAAEFSQRRARLFTHDRGLTGGIEKAAAIHEPSPRTATGKSFLKLRGKRAPLFGMRIRRRIVAESPAAISLWIPGVSCTAAGDVCLVDVHPQRSSVAESGEGGRESGPHLWKELLWRITAGTR